MKPRLNMDEIAKALGGDPSPPCARQVQHWPHHDEAPIVIATAYGYTVRRESPILAGPFRCPLIRRLVFGKFCRCHTTSSQSKRRKRSQ
jgi:hypothetical protein